MTQWPSIPLPEAYWFQEGPGVRKWQFRNSGIKLLNVANITKEGVLDLSKTDRYLSEDEVTEKYAHFLAEAGDLVIASSGVSFDEDGLLRTRGAFVEEHHLPLCLNTSTVRFKRKAGVSSLALLRYWLDSDEFREQITRLVTGSAQQNFGPSHLKATRISLPPLAEQERIVKLLDEADELRKLRAQADRRTAALIPAIFYEMFGDPMANPKRWELKQLGEVGKLDRGRSRHRPRDEPNLYGGPYPFIQTGDIANSTGQITRFSQTYSKVGLAQSRMWPAGTLCITIAANIAKTAVLTFDACFPDSVVGFVPGGEVLVEYVRDWFVTMEGQLEAAAPQAAQKNINLAILNELVIPVPPLSLQRQFAAQVAEVRALEAQQAASRRRLDDLFHSMLHRAFRGEL